MKHTLTSILVIGITLTAVTATGSFLYVPGLPPYPYISGYAFTYSHTYPPFVLSSSLDWNIGPTSLSVPPRADGISAEDISVSGIESEEILGNQSTPEPSDPATALGEASLSTAPSISNAPAEFLSTPTPSTPPFPIPSPAALGEAAPELPPSGSDELKYYHLSLPVTYTIPKPLAWPTATQYHQQDELGQYSYGYANEHGSKQELKLLDGVIRGAYNYIDADGKLQTVSYLSDGEGLRVAGTNLPRPVVPVDIPDAPEVAAAKVGHLQALSEAVANVSSTNTNANANDIDSIRTSVGGDGYSVISGCNETSDDSSSSKM